MMRNMSRKDYIDELVMHDDVNNTNNCKVITYNSHKIIILIVMKKA